MAFPTAIMTADEAAALIPDGAVVTVSSVLAASAVRTPCSPRSAERFDGQAIRATSPRCIPSPPATCGASRASTTSPGRGCWRRCWPAPTRRGPSSAEPPAIWQMVTGNAIPAYNIPSGILFDMHREAAAQAPGRADQGRPGHLRRSATARAAP